jgi:hypothetical protein
MNPEVKKKETRGKYVRFCLGMNCLRFNAFPTKYDGNCLPHPTKSGTDCSEMTRDDLYSNKFFLTY